MKIGIDISSLTLEVNGINTYLCKLLEYLAQVDRANEYYLYTNRKDNQKFIESKNSRFITRLAMNPHRLRWMQLQLPGLLKKDSIDVLHSPCYFTPLFSSVPKVTTIHDMATTLFPGQYTLGHRLTHSALAPASARNSRRIIADSRATGDDVARLYRIPQERIDVVHAGLDQGFYPRNSEEQEAVRNKFALHSGYVLFVGTIQPRKNVKGLLSAFHAARQAGRWRYKLVIAGARGWHCDDVFETVKNLGLEQEVVFTGPVPEVDLPALYSAASLFVLPSFYEGFGFPPLEAMACGVPVIASNSSCFPEILRDAAVLVPPEDTGALAKAIHRLLTDEPLRQELRAKGFNNIGRFTWETAARETLKVYEHAHSN